MSVSWRRMEGICDRCGWGKPPSKPMTDADFAGCCGIIGAVTVLPLVGMGMGYGYGGLGGLFVGLGVAIGLILAFFMYCVTSVGSKADKEADG